MKREPAAGEWLLPRLAESFEVLPCLHHTPRSLRLEPKNQPPPRRPRDFVDFLDSFIDRFGALVDWDWTLDPGSERFAEMIGDVASRARESGERLALGGMCPLDPTARIWISEAGFSTGRHDEAGQLAALVHAPDTPADRVDSYAAGDIASVRAACDGFHVDERLYHFGLFDAAGRPKLAARVLAAGGEGARRTAELVRPARRRPGPVVLVTGGAGFVGSNLTHALLARGERVRILDNLARPGWEQNLRRLQARHGGRIELVASDIRDRHALRDAVAGVRSVFHLAAQVAVTTSVDDPRADFDVNLGGTVALLEELRRLPHPPPLLFTSTNKVYGTLPDVVLERVRDRWLPVDEQLRMRGLDESRPLHFRTPYGCSKGGADQYVLDWASSYGLPAVVFRMSCVYGLHQRGTEDQGWVAHFLIRALADEPVTIFGDGAQVRDVLHADDLVRAMLVVRDRIDVLAGRVFNVGGGPDNALSPLELVDLIEKLQGTRPRVLFAEERLGDQRWYVSDTAALRAATEWRPHIRTPEGVAGLYTWLSAGPAPLQQAVSA